MEKKGKVINKDAKIIEHYLKDDGTFPNSIHPALVYKNAFMLPEGSHPGIIEDVFESNNWKNTWRNGIFNYNHYHSITHEVLGIFAGHCHLLLGGDEGIELDVDKGDVVIIPAGVAHKNLGSSADFKCVGAYPGGSDYDMNYGKAGERPKTDHNISLVQVPATCPVFGKGGPLLKHWVKQPS